ncbi:MAG: hypothetical protein ACRDQ0_03480 [Pseudonocardia sp.]
MYFSVLVASLLAGLATLFSPVPSEVAARPACTAFANTPTLFEDRVESNGGATCTAKSTGAFRVDVTLYRDGAVAARATNTCHGEQQCGVLVHDVDVEGGQQWCVTAVGSLTGSMKGDGAAPRTEMICEQQDF